MLVAIRLYLPGHWHRKTSHYNSQTIFVYTLGLRVLLYPIWEFHLRFLNSSVPAFGTLLSCVLCWFLSLVWRQDVWKWHQYPIREALELSFSFSARQRILVRCQVLGCMHKENRFSCTWCQCLPLQRSNPYTSEFKHAQKKQGQASWSMQPVCEQSWTKV